MMKRLMSARQVADFQVGTDKVIRRGNRCFIAQREGATAQYEELEVVSDVLTEQHKENFRKLNPSQRIRMESAIINDPYLSDEGRRERLEFIRSIE